MRHYLACDLGAESGRVMLGSVSGHELVLEELHRFPNTPVRTPTGLYWDVFRLFHEIQEGLAVAGRTRKLSLAGIGVDTWGVDFGLTGRDGSLVACPMHYRDSRNDGMLEKTFAVVPREEIFAETGIQFMQLNTLYQLHAMKLAGAPALDIAETLLFMPDLFHYWLTGRQVSELTIASTSQFYNPVEKRWASGLLERLGISVGLLPPIVSPGTALGPLLAHVRDDAGLDDTPVFATASHDTASAVAAVPAEGSDWCYISSGTWSLMGVEIDQPLIDGRSLQLNFTNEVGAGSKIRLLKNIAGLWLLQECRRAWSADGHNYSYEELARMAEGAAPFRAVINPDAFLHPGDMPAKIAEFCRSTGQQPREAPPEICRVILESLALRYRQVLESLEDLLGRSIGVIHIVGGGSRNDLLNRFVADCTGRTVVAGPSEATATGNVLVQMIGSGDLAGLDQARELVRRSFTPLVVAPRPSSLWDDAYDNFAALTAGRREKAPG